MAVPSDRTSKMLSINEVAQHLNVCTKTICRMIERDELRHHRIGNGDKQIIRVSAEDLRAYINGIRQ
jgi:excisionase family DNA binding protein